MASKKAFRRVLPMLLMVCMLVSLAPFASAEAEAEAAVEETAAEEAVVEPVIEEAAEAAPEAQAVELQTAPEETAEPAAVEAPAAPQEEGEGTYTVYYYTYNGESLLSGINTFSVSHAVGDTVSVAECTLAPRRSHSAYRWQTNAMYDYDFDGWTLTQGSSVNEHAGDVYPLDYPVGGSFEMPAHDVRLYAHYAIKDYYHWIITVSTGGKVEHNLNSSSADFIYLDNSSDPYKVFPTGLNMEVTGTAYHPFTPQPDDGYIFDGWYCNGEKLAVETLNASSFPKLTAAMYNAGQNTMEARFMENDGTYAEVIYKDYRVVGDYTYETVFFKQLLKIGDPMPTVDDPAVNNYYFLGWDKDIPETVPAEGITLTATWLEGPTSSNTAEELYKIHCVSGEGIGTGGSTVSSHADMGRGFANVTVSGVITREGDQYYTTVTATPNLGVGPGCYDVNRGQEHFLSESDPVVTLVWNGTQWVGDGDQVVNVYHENGDEEIPAATLAGMDPIICVTDSSDSTSYKELKLLDGTYDVEYTQTSGSTRRAQVTITDFDAYAKELGAYYVPDWDRNLHEQNYYVFYLTRSLTTKSIANGTTYYAWGAWGYDKLSTEFQSTGGVQHNESVSGKELLVKIPTYTITYTDELGILPDQSFEVKAGNPYPEYNWNAEGVNSAILDGEVVEKDGEWYRFESWDGLPFSFGRPAVVEEARTITAVWTPVTAYTITFTDGLDGAIFAPKTFVVLEGGELPWAEYTFEDGSYDLEAFLGGEFFGGENPYDVQMDDGRVFFDVLCTSNEDVVFWDLSNPDAEVTEDLDFEVMWAKYVQVIYRDGADGEVFEDYNVGEYVVDVDDFPAYPNGDPEREGYTFAGWVSVEDEAALDSYVDEDGRTVNVYEEEGIQYFVILLDAQWDPTGAEKPEFKGHQLVLSGQIGMHFYMTIPEGMADGTMTFTVGDRTVTASGALQNDGRYKFTCYVNSVEMAEQIEAVYSYMVDGETKTVSDTSSVKDYLEYIINNEQGLAAYTAATPLAKAIYNYGYYAMQAVPGGSKHPAMPDTYTGEAALITSLDGFGISAKLDKNVITKASYSLDLDSETAINFYLTTETELTKDNVSVTGDATFAYTVEKVGSRYRVQITGIGAHELGTVFTMTTGDTTISASAMTYVQQALGNDNASAATKNAAAALYAYYLQAISYH